MIAIPTNKPLRRVNHRDLVYRTEKEKWDAVVGEVEETYKSGRPVLIGTKDVDKSEKLSGMLKRRGIKHELLNAKPENVGREAEIVAQAGRIGAVTISHEHGRPRHRHHPRRQPRDAGVGPIEELKDADDRPALPDAARSAQRRLGQDRSARSKRRRR